MHDEPRPLTRCRITPEGIERCDEAQSRDRARAGRVARGESTEGLDVWDRRHLKAATWTEDHGVR